jgi:hypothetical protein
MNSFQVVLEKIFMNNFLLSEEITSAFPKLLGNCSWVLGQCNENDVTITICYLVSNGNDVTVTVCGNDAHLCLPVTYAT